MRMLKISKNIFICLLALTANSCTSPSPNPLPTKSVTCPDKPLESLSASDVKNINLSATAVKESGSISASKMKGFTFKAKKGQQIEYKTSENLCIWVFSQDNKLITGKTLSSDGNYTLQITVPQGTTTFGLEMSLDANESPKPVAVITPNTSPTPLATRAPEPKQTTSQARTDTNPLSLNNIAGEYRVVLDAKVLADAEKEGVKSVTGKWTVRADGTFEATLKAVSTKNEVQEIKTVGKITLQNGKVVSQVETVNGARPAQTPPIQTYTLSGDGKELQADGQPVKLVKL